jgi:hypothetical protein
MIPNGTRFIGIAPEVDLTERGSALLNKRTEPYTIDDIRGYKVFTALLTQSGGNEFQSLNEGTLTIGVTYLIQLLEGADFSNVGANNIEGEYFVATGTTPNSWGIGGQLEYDTGAPVVNVLENTIGNIWFTYENEGYYGINCNGLFNNVFVPFPMGSCNSIDGGVVFQIDNFTNNNIRILTLIGGSFVSINGALLNTPIEIRVYN